MISLHVRRKFIDLISKNYYVFCESHVAFSTSTKKQPIKTSTTIELLLQKHHFSPKTVSKVAAALPNLKNPENLESVISFLKGIGFSSPQLEKFAKTSPQFLSFNLETKIKPKLKILQGLGYSESELSELIANDPWVLSRATDTIVRSLSVLKGLVGSDAEVANLVRTSGWFLTKDLGKSMVPNVEFLKSCGIPLQQIVRLTYHFPRFLLSGQEIIRRSVEKADEMGVSRSSKIFIHAVRVVSSMHIKTWEMKLQAFRDLGFSEEDISRAFRQSPIVFSISEKKMMEIKEVVLASGKYDMSCIINSPTALCRSIENWYKRRLQVLGILETKNLITNWPSFATMARMPEREFFGKFVAPYLDEVGDVYGKRIAVRGTKKAKHVSST